MMSSQSDTEGLEAYSECSGGKQSGVDVELESDVCKTSAATMDQLVVKNGACR